MAEDRDSHELLLEALAVLGKAFDADRRDRKEDRARARGEVIDTTATEAPSNGAPKNGSNGHASAPSMKRPEVARCAEAKELAEMLEDLDEQQALKLRELLTAAEVEAIFRCADAPTREDFDRNFADVDAEWQKRGKIGTSALQSQLATVLGFKAFTFKNLIVKWEKRTHGSPPR